MGGVSRWVSNSSNWEKNMCSAKKERKYIYGRREDLVSVSVESMF